MLANILPYDGEFYYDLVDWFQQRNLIAPTQFDLPEIGYIIPGVGAGFLISTDTKTAIIDFLIMNPMAEPEARKDAIGRIAKALTKRAKLSGFTGIACNTQIETIKRHALGLGFRSLGEYSCFSKEI